MCIYHIYYVVHFLPNLSEATIHLLMHAYLIINGKCKELFKEMKNMVVKEILCTHDVTSSTISLVVSKIFLSHHLFNEDGQGVVELLKGHKLNETLLNFTPSCSPIIRNLISMVKHHLKKIGSIDSIMTFNTLSPYDYI
jgi:hypothetical protein